MTKTFRSQKGERSVFSFGELEDTGKTLLECNDITTECFSVLSRVLCGDYTRKIENHEMTDGQLIVRNCFAGR